MVATPSAIPATGHPHCHVRAGRSAPRRRKGSHSTTTANGTATVQRGTPSQPGTVASSPGSSTNVSPGRRRSRTTSSPAAHPTRATIAPSIPAPSLKYRPDTQLVAVTIPAPMSKPPATLCSGSNGSPRLSWPHGPVQPGEGGVEALLAALEDVADEHPRDGSAQGQHHRPPMASTDAGSGFPGHAGRAPGPHR